MALTPATDHPLLALVSVLQSDGRCQQLPEPRVSSPLSIHNCFNFDHPNRAAAAVAPGPIKKSDNRRAAIGSGRRA
jgi:hypothetical protein